MNKKLLYKLCAMMMIPFQLVTFVGCQGKDTALTMKTNEVEVNKVSDEKVKLEESATEEQDLPIMTLSAVPATYTWSGEAKTLAFTPDIDEPTLAEDFSNVINFDQFKGFTEGQLEMLRQNGFVVMEQQRDYPYLKMHQIYEGAVYSDTPVFISTDAVLNLYHIFYSESLKGLETSELLGDMKELSRLLFEQSLGYYKDAQYAAVKKQLETITAYYGIACTLLGENVEIPSEIKSLVEEEVSLIEKAGGLSYSPLLGKNMDYSQYTVRGHYAGTENLSTYFKAMMWYGQVGFLLVDDQGEVIVENAQLSTMMSMLLLGEKEALALWDRVYTATSIYVGATDDVTVYDFQTLIQEVFGDDVGLLQIVSKKYEEALKEAVKALPEPQIVGKIILTPDTVTGKQFRVMGQRYTLDGDVMQTLMEPIKRPVPSGLDVMAALGSTRAEVLVERDYEASKKWPDYSIKLKSLKERIAQQQLEAWNSNLYNGWLWTVQAASQSFEKVEGMPRFMQNSAWTDKSIQTALGSYAELKHDTVLYSKQPVAEMGGPGGNMPYIYVEPNVEVYTRLLYLIENTKASLENKGLLNEQSQDVLGRIASHLEVIRTCAIKELQNENFTEEEYDDLMAFGGMVDSVSVQLANMNLSFDETTNENYTSALVSDVATVLDVANYVELGTGIPYKIYVICPYKGKLFLAEGALFSYYEFLWDERLTDEKWHEMLGIEKVVDAEYGYEFIRMNETVNGYKALAPTWTKSFVSSEPNNIERTGVEVIWDSAMLPNNPTPGPDGKYDYE